MESSDPSRSSVPGPGVGTVPNSESVSRKRKKERIEVTILYKKTY